MYEVKLDQPVANNDCRSMCRYAEVTGCFQSELQEMTSKKTELEKPVKTFTVNYVKDERDMQISG